MKGKKKMKKKTKEILEILKGFMINSELKNHTAEIVLYKKSDSHFTIASYISNILDNNEESSLYIGTEIDAQKINESNPCLWLASLLDLNYEIIYHYRFTVRFGLIILMYMMNWMVMKIV